MTATIRALHIDLDGSLRDLDIGATLDQQSKVIGHALLDSVEADRPAPRSSYSPESTASTGSPTSMRVLPFTS
ncbi:MAG: hypothetical protein WCD21_42845 [Streptomyces sp.]